MNPEEYEDITPEEAHAALGFKPREDLVPITREEALSALGAGSYLDYEDITPEEAFKSLGYTPPRQKSAIGPYAPKTTTPLRLDLPAKVVVSDSLEQMSQEQRDQMGPATRRLARGGAAQESMSAGSSSGLNPEMARELETITAAREDRFDDGPEGALARNVVLASIAKAIPQFASSFPSSGAVVARFGAQHPYAVPTMGLSLIADAAGIPLPGQQAVTDAIRPVVNPIAQDLEWAAKYGQGISDAVEMDPEASGSIWDSKSPGQLAKRVTSGLIVNLPQLAASIKVGGGPLGQALMWAMEAGGAQQDLVRQGMDPDKAANASAAIGVVNSFLEKWGATTVGDGLMRRVGGKSALMRLLLPPLTEGGTEFSQDLPQMLVERLNSLENAPKSFWEAFLRASESGVFGGLLGAPAGIHSATGPATVTPPRLTGGAVQPGTDKVPIPGGTPPNLKVVPVVPGADPFRIAAQRAAALMGEQPQGPYTPETGEGSPLSPEERANSIAGIQAALKMEEDPEVRSQYEEILKVLEGAPKEVVEEAKPEGGKPFVRPQPVDVLTDEQILALTPEQRITRERQREAFERKSQRADMLNDLGWEAHARENPVTPDGWTEGFNDLTQFKELNDQIGHDVGDAALYAWGERLKAFAAQVAEETGAKVEVFHRSGDEFKTRASTPEAAARITELVNGQEHVVSGRADIGGVVYAVKDLALKAGAGHGMTPQAAEDGAKAVKALYYTEKGIDRRGDERRKEGAGTPGTPPTPQGRGVPGVGSPDQEGDGAGGETPGAEGAQPGDNPPEVIPKEPQPPKPKGPPETGAPPVIRNRQEFESALVEVGYKGEWARAAGTLVDAFAAAWYKAHPSFSYGKERLYGDLFAEVKAGNASLASMRQAEKSILRGRVSFDASRRAVIELFKGANASTVPHELAHVFRRHLSRIDSKLTAAANEYVGADSITWTTEQEEKFARAFERWLREGVAPRLPSEKGKNLAPGSYALDKVFAQFKTWLSEIYTSIKGTPIEQTLTPEIKNVFKAMLGADVVWKSDAGMTPSDRVALESARGNIAQGDPGGRVALDMDGAGSGKEWKGYGSTYPNYFRDKGWSKKESLAAIDRALAGKPLTDRAQEMVQTFISGEHENMGAEFGEKYDQWRKEQDGLEQADQPGLFGEYQAKDKKRGKYLPTDHAPWGTDETLFGGVPAAAPEVGPKPKAGPGPKDRSLYGGDMFGPEGLAQADEAPGRGPFDSMTPQQLEEMDFGVPEGGSSMNPRTAFKIRKSGEFETLADLASQRDSFRFFEVLGKGWTHEWKSSLHLSGKIRARRPITIYRASDVGPILPGAYVSESLQYVQDHGETRIPGGKFRIYKMEVPPDELMIYGDPHEFIYLPKTPEGALKALKAQVDIGGDTLEQADLTLSPPDTPQGMPSEVHQMLKATGLDFQGLRQLAREGRAKFMQAGIGKNLQAGISFRAMKWIENWNAQEASRHARAQRQLIVDAARQRVAERKANPEVWNKPKGKTLETFQTVGQGGMEPADALAKLGPAGEPLTQKVLKGHSNISWYGAQWVNAMVLAKRAMSRRERTWLKEKVVWALEDKTPVPAGMPNVQAFMDAWRKGNEAAGAMAEEKAVRVVDPKYMYPDQPGRQDALATLLTRVQSFPVADANGTMKLAVSLTAKPGQSAEVSKAISSYLETFQVSKAQLLQDLNGYSYNQRVVKGGDFHRRNPETYVPHQFTDEIRQALKDQSGAVWDALKKDAMTQGIDPMVLVRIAQGDTLVTKKYGSLENARIANLPRTIEVNGKTVKVLQDDPAMLYRHLHRMARRLAIIEQFGQDSAEYATILAREISEASGGAIDPDVFSAIIVSMWSQLQGTGPTSNFAKNWPKLHTSLQAGGATAATAQLSAAVIPNLLGGHLPSSIRMGIVPTLKGFFHAWTTTLSKEDADLLMAGNLLQDITGQLMMYEDAGERIIRIVRHPLKWTGFILANSKINQAIAWSMAHINLKAMLDAIQRDDKRFLARHWGWSKGSAMRYLVNELRFSEADVERMVKEGPLPEDLARAIGMEKEIENAINESPATRPPVVNNLIFKLILAYSTYQRKFAKTTTYAINETKHGNFAPLARLMVMSTITGEVIQAVRAFVKDREREDKDNWAMRLLNDFLECASLGLWGTAIDLFKMPGAATGRRTLQSITTPALMEFWAGMADAGIQSGKKMSLRPFLEGSMRNIPAVAIVVAQTQKLATGTEMQKRDLAKRLSRMVYIGGNEHEPLEPRPGREKTSELLLKRWRDQGYQDWELIEMIRESREK